jgi:hypothetical protein
LHGDAARVGPGNDLLQGAADRRGARDQHAGDRPAGPKRLQDGAAAYEGLIVVRRPVQGFSGPAT